MKRRTPEKREAVGATRRSESRTARAASGAPRLRDALTAPDGPPPALARDPWALVAVLSVLPLILHSLGAPLGEPFADDFDYLHRVLLGGPLTFFDGCGSALYWRPLGRQVYYSLLAPAILGAPWPGLREPNLSPERSRHRSRPKARHNQRRQYVRLRPAVARPVDRAAE